MKWVCISVVFVTLLLVAACTAQEPTATTAPKPDIGVTVDATVKATSPIHGGVELHPRDIVLEILRG